MQKNLVVRQEAVAAAAAAPTGGLDSILFSSVGGGLPDTTAS